MKNNAQRFIAAACLSLLVIGTATAQSAQEDFETVFAGHKGKLGYDRFRVQFLEAVEKFNTQRRNQKALAVARDIGGRWAYGTSHSERNRGDAKQTAMQNCKKFRAKFTIDAPCKIYMVNKKLKLEQY